MNINVLEIRNYLLKPQLTQHFIDTFEAVFIFSQQAVNMHVLGQFRVIGEPDHYVWLRGFNDMQTRLEALRSFYGGPVWRQYGKLANEMIVDSDNVHLLRPLGDTLDLTCGLNASGVAADLAAGTISPYTGAIAIDFYEAVPGKRDALVEQFQTQVMPIYQNEAIEVRGCFVAEMSENEYPRLPALQNPDEFVVVTAYASEEACREQCEKVMPQIQEIVGGLLSRTPEALLLSPTLRSPLRYMPA